MEKKIETTVVWYHRLGGMKRGSLPYENAGILRRNSLLPRLCLYSCHSEGTFQSGKHILFNARLPSSTLHPNNEYHQEAQPWGVVLCMRLGALVKLF